MKLVSVIVPCFNGAAFLSECLESVEEQTYQNWECIIIDDGSTDESANIAALFVSRDIRFKYFYKSNGGLSSARNFGLDNAKGEAIQFLDADDILLSEKLFTQVNQFENNSVNAVSICNYELVETYDRSKLISKTTRWNFSTKDYLRELLLMWEEKLSIPCHCFLFSIDVFEHIRFDESLPNHEDLDCWLNIFRNKPRVDVVDKVLCLYRSSATSMSSNNALMYEGYIMVLNKQQRSIPLKEYRTVIEKKKNRLHLRNRRFANMDFKYRILFIAPIVEYYLKRLFNR